MKKLIAFLTISLLCFMSFSENSNKYPELKARQKALKEFQDMKFGMFVHWGPVSLRGTEIGWSRGHQVAKDDYDNLYKEFNPVLFNADDWIKVLKDAGMKYFVLTTRHHDGFSLWDTEYSEYNIMNTPFKRDVLKELKEACDKYDILFGTYYSICDWWHPNYPISRIKGIEKPEADMEKHFTYIKNQTTELIQEYNTKLLWFDGEWEKPWTHEYGLELYTYLKGLDNNILINNRVDKGRRGMEGSTAPEFAGDFATPEQQIGAFNIKNPWESCITICNQWAWKPNDKMKSFTQCIRTLLKVVGGGGNLLLNVGPMPDGRIEQRQIDRLKEIGNWLKEYGESVYKTTGGPYQPTEWISSTRKENKIYLHLYSLNGNKLILPSPGKVKVKSSSILNGEQLFHKQTKETLIIQVPEKVKNKTVTTIVLELKENANGISPIEIN